MCVVVCHDLKRDPVVHVSEIDIALGLFAKPERLFGNPVSGHRPLQADVVVGIDIDYEIAQIVETGPVQKGSVYYQIPVRM